VSFEIKLPLFEGPFDLLLFFIERDELDIYDIPISRITKDFLHYIHHLEMMNIEIVSEFILVAATLMRIKSKMLLPRPELDDEGIEIDPREELIQRLMEYKKYKSVVGELASLEEARKLMHSRGNLMPEIKKLSETTNVETELQDVDLYKLLRVYQKAIKKFDAVQEKPLHTVIQFPYNIAEKKEYILNVVQKKSKVSFRKLLEMEPSKIAVIFNFLAILELLQLGQLVIRVGLGFNNFWISNTPAQQQAECCGAGT
jgi:segregation and condensation protein A